MSLNKKNKARLDQVWTHIRQKAYQDGLNQIARLSPAVSRNPLFLLAKARCLQGLKHFDAALDVYEEITSTRELESFGLSMALCYEEMGLYGVALTLYRNINLPKTHGRFYECYLGQARCYQQLGKYEAALNICNEISHPKAMVLAAQIHFFLGDTRAAYKLLDQAVNQLPNDWQSTFNLIQCYMANDDESVPSLIEQVLTKWPAIPEFALLKAKSQAKSDIRQAIATLNVAREKFPHHDSIYLYSIQLYLLIRDQVSARNKMNAYITQHPHDVAFVGSANALFDMPLLMLVEHHLSNRYGYAARTKQIELPAPIKKQFKLLESVPSEAYLIGSSVWKILEENNTHLSGNVDLDFFLLGKNCVTPTALGYLPSPFVNGLYTLRRGNEKVDVFLLQDNPESLPFRYDDRVFTVCALFVGKNGCLHDPSGMGIRDFESKTLRVIGNAKVRFSERPELALRAIAYELKGFKQTADGAEALCTFPLKYFNPNKVYKLARKHLYTLNGLEYVKLLQKYDLLERIFGVSSMQTTEDILRELEIKLMVVKVDVVKEFEGRLFPAHKRSSAAAKYRSNRPPLLPTPSNVMRRPK